jgi:hypothetical protein
MTIARPGGWFWPLLGGLIASGPAPCKPPKSGKSGYSTRHYEEKDCREADEDKREYGEPPWNGGVRPNLCSYQYRSGSEQGVGGDTNRQARTALCHSLGLGPGCAQTEAGRDFGAGGAPLLTVQLADVRVIRVLDFEKMRWVICYPKRGPGPGQGNDGQAKSPCATVLPDAQGCHSSRTAALVEAARSLERFQCLLCRWLVQSSRRSGQQDALL